MKYRILIIFIVLFTIFSFNLVNSQECSNIAYSCTEFSGCSDNKQIRQCGIMDFCNNKYNIDPSFEIINPINEEIHCNDFDINLVKKNQTIYFDIQNSNAIINIIDNFNFDLHIKNNPIKIKILDIKKNYTIINIDNFNYIVYNDKTKLFDLNGDSIDDTEFSIYGQKENKKILSIKLLEYDNKFGKSDQLKDKQIIELEKVNDNLEEENTLVLNVMIIFLILICVILFIRLFYNKENQIESELLKRKDLVKINNKNPVENKLTKDQKRKLVLVSRKTYYKNIDQIIEMLKNKLNKVKRNNKIIENIERKNKGLLISKKTKKKSKKKNKK
ncbi:hypothetical protein HOK68_00580 [Candidatus Woesearchaeota archaeon]|jgi:hypothetical protein|nr:hypothetical protein [Candidatus Woesearchaeota archaeon]MBT4387584.1 hypothetical protein [Candidatus Woesearchaeota archaeon]MBT4595900.1 hypothetical protein [Candidatus Woesearchaeota archaeon]MBT5741030.1 hypothetical protein [Candidatus Woesearchaeota archaeon]MBT6505257.1 hypothetical protein [Candidatus Woesearchaeota archaeon]